MWTSMRLSIDKNYQGCEKHQLSRNFLPSSRARNVPANENFLHMDALITSTSDEQICSEDMTLELELSEYYNSGMADGAEDGFNLCNTSRTFHGKTEPILPSSVGLFSNDLESSEISEGGASGVTLEFNYITDWSEEEGESQNYIPLATVPGKSIMKSGSGVMGQVETPSDISSCFDTERQLTSSQIDGDKNRRMRRKRVRFAKNIHRKYIPIIVKDPELPPTAGVPTQVLTRSASRKAGYSIFGDNVSLILPKIDVSRVELKDDYANPLSPSNPQFINSPMNTENVGVSYEESEGVDTKTPEYLNFPLMHEKEWNANGTMRFESNTDGRKRNVTQKLNQDIIYVADNPDEQIQGPHLLDLQLDEENENKQSREEGKNHNFIKTTESLAKFRLREVSLVLIDFRKTISRNREYNRCSESELKKHVSTMFERGKLRSGTSKSGIGVMHSISEPIPFTNNPLTSFSSRRLSPANINCHSGTPQSGFEKVSGVFPNVFIQKRIIKLPKSNTLDYRLSESNSEKLSKHSHFSNDTLQINDELCSS